MIGQYKPCDYDNYTYMYKNEYESITTCIKYK